MPLRELLPSEKTELLARHATTSELLRSPAAYETKLQAIENFGQYLFTLYPGIPSTDISAGIATIPIDEVLSEADIKAHDFVALDQIIEEGLRRRASLDINENHGAQTLNCGVDSFLTLLHHDNLTQHLLADVSLLARPGQILQILASPHCNPENDLNDARALRLYRAHKTQFSALAAMKNAVLEGNLDALYMCFSNLFDAYNNTTIAASWVSRYTDTHGHTLLHELAESQNNATMAAMTQQLLRWGIDLNAVNHDNQTTLHLSAMKGNTSLCTELLSRLDNLQLNIKDRHGYTAIGYAINYAMYQDNYDGLTVFLRHVRKKMSIYDDFILSLYTNISDIKKDIAENIYAFCIYQAIDLYDKISHDDNIKCATLILQTQLCHYLRSFNILESISSFFSDVSSETKEFTIRQLQDFLEGCSVKFTDDMLYALKNDTRLVEILQSPIAKRVIDVDNIKANTQICLSSTAEIMPSTSSSTSISSLSRAFSPAYLPNSSSSSSNSSLSSSSSSSLSASCVSLFSSVELVAKPLPSEAPNLGTSTTSPHRSTRSFSTSSIPVPKKADDFDWNSRSSFSQSMSGLPSP